MLSSRNQRALPNKGTTRDRHFLWAQAKGMRNICIPTALARYPRQSAGVCGTNRDIQTRLPSSQPAGSPSPALPGLSKYFRGCKRFYKREGNEERKTGNAELRGMPRCSNPCSPCKDSASLIPAVLSQSCDERIQELCSLECRSVQTILNARSFKSPFLNTVISITAAAVLWWQWHVLWTNGDFNLSDVVRSSF